MAARFSGVNIGRLKMLLFVAFRRDQRIGRNWFLHSGFPVRGADNGTGFELSAIAAVFLGGVTVQGGKGTVTGVVLYPSADWYHQQTC